MEQLLTHEYLFAIYGVILWQTEQCFFSKELPIKALKDAGKGLLRSMTWVGLVVVFDDEMLATYNEWAAVDYSDAPKWLYTVAGFFIDMGRSYFIKYK